MSDHADTIRRLGILNPDALAALAALEAERQNLAEQNEYLMQANESVLAERQQAIDALRERTTELHSLRWLLGLETHEGEEPQSREESHRNLDALLEREAQ